MGIGSRPLRSKAVRVIESSILGTTAWDVCLVLLSFLRCISPLLLVVIFIFQQIATTRTNGKFIQRYVLGWVNIWKKDFGTRTEPVISYYTWILVCIMKQLLPPSIENEVAEENIC